MYRGKGVQTPEEVLQIGFEDPAHTFPGNGLIEGRERMMGPNTRSATKRQLSGSRYPIGRLHMQCRPLFINHYIGRTARSLFQLQVPDTIPVDPERIEMQISLR